MIDIILPTYNQSDYTVRMLESLARHHSTGWGIRILWHDNGSTAAEAGIVESALERLFVNWIPMRCRENLGFIRAVNVALKFSAEGVADYVVIANNDIEFHDAALYKLRACLQSDSTLGVVSPVSTAGWQDWRKLYEHFSDETMANLYRSKTDRERCMLLDMAPYPPLGVSNWSVGVPTTSPLAVYREVTGMVAFFCAMFPRKVFDKVGLLDERFGPGLGDDDQYCLRMRRMGYGRAVCLNTLVTHFHRTTFKALYSDDELIELQQRNMQKLEEWKHGQLTEG